MRLVVSSWAAGAYDPHAHEVPGLRRFLVGRFFYSDAVNTVIVVMSVVLVQAVGLTSEAANVVLLPLTVVAIVDGFAWGWMVDRHRAEADAHHRARLVGGGLDPRGDRARAIRTGAVPDGRGRSWSRGDPRSPARLGPGRDRVFMVRLSPPARVGEFFGIYGLVGKASQVIGQLAVRALIVFLLLDSLGHGRLPGRDPEPDRDDAHRAVARVAGQRPLGGPGECGRVSTTGRTRGHPAPPPGARAAAPTGIAPAGRSRCAVSRP